MRKIEVEVWNLDRDCGIIPALQWVAIKDLVVDDDYQRDLFGKGKKNIQKIAANFDWSKFSTVIVAAVGGGKFAIVDGQHRCTAAAMRKIEIVPCQIITADKKKQAEAFAAINAVTTAMSSLQVHAARVVARDEASLKLDAVCKKAGVEICRYPVPANEMKIGETLACVALYKSLERWGEEILELALKAVTKTKQDGNIGMLRAQVIRAFCSVLEFMPEWRDEKKFIQAMKTFDLKGAFKRARYSEGAVGPKLIEFISEHCAKNFK